MSWRDRDVHWTPVDGEKMDILVSAKVQVLDDGGMQGLEPAAQAFAGENPAAAGDVRIQEEY